MLKKLAYGLLIMWLVVAITATGDDFPQCNCEEDEGFWSVDLILECQKASDFLIGIAYFSIPIEILYFISRAHVPFKWVLFEFIAFIVLCGLTHFLHYWTYGPHTFRLVLWITIFKILTALVSVGTAITLFSLIPLLLQSKVREFFLKKKACDLDREVGLIKQKKEAGLHVRMLTQVIRNSIDRHTILYTTLVELSKTLDLMNCAVWMPNENRTEMNLTHSLRRRDSNEETLHIPINDLDVRDIKESNGVKILEPDSLLAVASSDGTAEPGNVAAIRMPMLSGVNFKGGTPEHFQTCYAILVLVLPYGQGRSWSDQDIQIVKVVADQVAVALSHASILEESQSMTEKLTVQNRALQHARQEALKASEARNAFQSVMSNGLRRPMHSILGLLSMMQDQDLSAEQRLIIDSMVKTSSVVSTLINDVMDTSPKGNLEMTSFQLKTTIKEATCLAKCLCVYKGCAFSVKVDKSLPIYVMGDERRLIQVILYMVGNLLNDSDRGILSFHVSIANNGSEKKWGPWRPDSGDGFVYVRFEVGVSNRSSHNPSSPKPKKRVQGDLSFNICRKLVQLMQGDIWEITKSEEFDQSMVLVLRFQIRPSMVMGPGTSTSEHEQSNSNTLFKGMHVLLVDNDDVNRAVTRKLLQKLGCIVSAVSSGYECLSALGPAVSSFQIVLLDLHLPDLNGFEVTQRIRKFRNHGWPLIVALTAIGDEYVWEKCLQNGINGVIQKPVLLRGIADELRRVLMQAQRIMT